MSTKEQIIEAVRGMPEGASFDEILVRITALRGEADALARKADLAAMASDPEIQAELRHIEEEFAGTESDGLEGV